MLLMLSHPALSGSSANMAFGGPAVRDVLKLSHPALSGSSANSYSAKTAGVCVASCHTLLFRVLLQMMSGAVVYDASRYKLSHPALSGSSANTTYARIVAVVDILLSHPALSGSSANLNFHGGYAAYGI